MCKTIKQRVRFSAPPSTIYKLLANQKEFRAFTGKPASIHPSVGGKFSTHQGSITGINVDLVPGKRIVRAWRERRFPEGVFSMAAFVLLPTPTGGTELTLTHRGVPKDLIPEISENWRTLYWGKIKNFIKNHK